MKTRKEALQDEIKIYEDMIEKAKERRETTSSYLEIHQIKYQIKVYKEEIRMDEKEINEIEFVEASERLVKQQELYDEEKRKEKKSRKPIFEQMDISKGFEREA